MNTIMKNIVYNELLKTFQGTNLSLMKEDEIVRILTDDYMINSVYFEHILHIKKKYDLRMFVCVTSNKPEVCLK